MSKRLSQKKWEGDTVVRERRERLNLLVKCQVVSSMLLLNRYNVQSVIWLVWNMNKRTKDSGYLLALINKGVSFLAPQNLQGVTDAT